MSNYHDLCLQKAARKQGGRPRRSVRELSPLLVVQYRWMQQLLPPRLHRSNLEKIENVSELKKISKITCCYLLPTEVVRNLGNTIVRRSHSTVGRTTVRLNSITHSGNRLGICQAMAGHTHIKAQLIKSPIDLNLNIFRLWKEKVAPREISYAYGENMKSALQPIWHSFFDMSPSISNMGQL